MSAWTGGRKSERIRLLKQYEHRCYQIAFYLLNCEQKAVAAAQHALLELANDRSFLTAPADVRDMKARKIAMKQAFAVHLDEQTAN